MNLDADVVMGAMADLDAELDAVRREAANELAALKDGERAQELRSNALAVVLNNYQPQKGFTDLHALAVQAVRAAAVMEAYITSGAVAAGPDFSEVE